MSHFLKLFNKMGGFEYLKQLVRCRILFFSLITIVLMGFKQKSMEISRLAINNRRLQRIRTRSKKKINDYLSNAKPDLEKKHSNKVWFLWLQGLDSAPVVVKKCYLSLKEKLKCRDIILLTEKNYHNYVSFPSFIQQKINAGIITKTHFSDLLRLELLEHYGGTWIDATVYCSDSDYPDYLFDSDLFVFQCLKPGLDGESLSISSWFMTATTNHPVILLTKHLLYDYWKKNNSLIDYFLIHDYFELALETFPEERKKIIPYCNSLPHMLQLRLFDPYEEQVWKAIRRQTSFHKLTYKFHKDQEIMVGTFFEHILKKD